MKRDHSKLICDISELSGVFTDTSNLDTLLQNIVEMISLHMEADVCSIYLYYEEAQELVLRATKGLKSEAVGSVKLPLGEGLVGLAVKERRSVYEPDAPASPHFRFFDNIGEERYRSFLALPILRGQNRIGVITLQSVEVDYFSPEDINVFRAITSQLANTIEMAKLLFSVDSVVVEKEFAGSTLKGVKGRVGSEGLACGEAKVIAPTTMDNFISSVNPEDRTYTVEDFRNAVLQTEKELKGMQDSVEERLFDVASLIFSAQIMMLRDQSLLSQVEAKIKSGIAVSKAIYEVIMAYASRFDQMDNEFIREKRFDIIDVGRRLLETLTGKKGRRTGFEDKVVIARELLPSDILKLSSQNVAGIILLSGGVTSHVAVLARSLNIPLIIADEKGLLSLREGTQIFMDAEQGDIYIDPDEPVLAAFHEKKELQKDLSKSKNTVLPETHTKDGKKITLLANINLLGDLVVAKEYKAEGVGLYRTEFPFIVRNDFPSEEEQYVIYRRLLEGVRGQEVTVRSLDIGGDKMLSYYDYSKEANPFLGLRSIRFSLKHRDIFMQQIRAILRAGLISPIRLMFPMISSLDEFREAREIVNASLAELSAEGVPHQEELSLGMMVELPSVIETIEDFAQEVDFFSIGTNDLIQYTLAVDRTNEKVSDLYIPHHPAVLRALNKIAQAALKYDIDVSVCGDMAYDVRYVPFFVGIGIKKLSLNARYFSRVQKAIGSITFQEARLFADEALKATTVSETTALFIQ